MLVDIGQSLTEAFFSGLMILFLIYCGKTAAETPKQKPEDKWQKDE